MGESDVFRPEQIYSENVSGLRHSILKWFHRSRLRSFAELIGDDGGTALSIGCGTGEFAEYLLEPRYDRVIGLELRRDRALRANERVSAVQSNAVTLPFATNSIDSIVGAGVIEHLDDQEHFLAEASRCLCSDGTLYLTAPVEVGVSGYLRHCGREFVEETHRYTDYSFAEMTKAVPRQKHGTGEHDHRYYNYKHLLEDLEEEFNHLRLVRWPLDSAVLPSLIVNIRASKTEHDIR